MLIKTFSGRTVTGPTDANGYWEDRQGHDLYRLMVGISRALFPEAASAIDVGCYTSGLLLELDWIPRRVASDVNQTLPQSWKAVEEVSFVCGDAFELDFGETFDLVISNQTVEHLDNPSGFVDKLLSIGRGLILSTTYETPAGLIPGHVQDPIDFDKFSSWFPCELDMYTVCYHPSRKIGHIIAAVKQSHPAARL